MKKKYKNKFFFKLLVLILLITPLITSCQNNKRVTKEPRKITIGVCNASMKQEVFPIMKEAMEENKEKDNVELIWLDSNSDKEKEKENIESLIKKKVDIIIFNPVNSDSSKKLVEKINKEKIPVFALDRLVEDIYLSGYITANSFQVGMEQAEYLVEQIDHEGEIIILKGDKENNVAYEMTTGNKEILKKNPKIKIAAEEWHKDWSPELAEKTVRKALEEHPEIKGILANNSAMIMAAVKVLKEKKLTDKITTVGADASKEACIAIAKGEHNADIDKMPYVMGLAAFKAASMVVRGQNWYYSLRIKNGEHSIPVTLTPILLIDKYNIFVMENRWKEIKKYIDE